MIEIAKDYSEPACGERESAAGNAILRLLDSYRCDCRHAQQVAFLSTRLFDELQPLHHFGAVERHWLQCAALLHDVGRGWSKRGHHKESLRIILRTDLPFDLSSRLIIGCTARYHRKALPSKRHYHFAQLQYNQQKTVLLLAAILRVADGLDRWHHMEVKGLWCEIAPGHIIGRCTLPDLAPHYVSTLMTRVFAKGRLFEQVFNRKLVLKLCSA